MFTCIIPTLWKSRRIIQLVKDLCGCESVGEVIIIDNAPDLGNFTTDAAHKSLIEDHSKLKILKMEKNIYVNPAWNLGVENATHDDIALVNDDVNFNADTLFKIFEDGSLVNNGVIGMATENYKLKVDGVIKIENRSITLGWGCIILVNKKNYVPIPDDLLIWCGDNWLLTRIIPSTLSGLKISTEMSSSCKYFDEITRNDRKTFNVKYGKA